MQVTDSERLQTMWAREIVERLEQAGYKVQEVADVRGAM